MTPSEITRLRDLASRATKGPWTLGNKKKFKQHIDSPTGRWYGLCHVYHSLKNYDEAIPQPEGEANAAFIAAANPKAVTELLDEIERLRGCLTMLQNGGIVSAGARPTAKEPTYAEIVDILREACLQIEHLHDHCAILSSVAVLARIRGLLSRIDSTADA